MLLYAILKKKRGRMMAIPNDPIILLSYINMKLRYFYPSLDELCKSLSIDQAELVSKLAAVGYAYDPARNQFR